MAGMGKRRFWQDGSGSTARSGGGTAASGVTAHARGWNVGGRVRMHADGSEDVCLFAVTSGSHDTWQDKELGSVRLDESGAPVFTPSAWTMEQVAAHKRRTAKQERQERKERERQERHARYRSHRQDGRVSARAALEWARTEDNAPDFDWQERRSADGMYAEFRQCGFDVRLTFQGDYDGDFTLGTFTNTWHPDAVELPEPRERGTYRYYRPSVSYREHAASLSALGMSRHEADCLARRYVREDMERDANGRECVWLRVQVSRAGVELASDSLGGIELDWTNHSLATRELGSMAQDIIPGTIEAARAALVAITTK